MPPWLACFLLISKYLLSVCDLWLHFYAFFLDLGSFVLPAIVVFQRNRFVWKDKTLIFTVLKVLLEHWQIDCNRWIFFKILKVKPVCSVILSPSTCVVCMCTHLSKRACMYGGQSPTRDIFLELSSLQFWDWLSYWLVWSLLPNPRLHLLSTFSLTDPILNRLLKGGFETDSVYVRFTLF